MIPRRLSATISLDPESTAVVHRRILCGFTLAMMALSWPIWHTNEAIPRFPATVLSALVADEPSLDRWLVAICVGGLLLSLRKGVCGRAGAFAVAVSGLALVLCDQNRLQAWFYQTLVLSAVYALLPGASAIGFARFFAVTLYFHSALSKLDWSFAHSMGPSILSPILQNLPFALAPRAQTGIVLALPIGELLFALALAFGRFRVGLAGATLMHLALLLLLGPWLLDHSGNVLLWNVSMLLQAWVLFAPAGKAAPFGPDTPETAPATPPAALGLVQLGMLAVAILPFFERAGLWDPWPSFALYAGHVEQLRIDWPAELKDRVPADYRPFLKPDGGDIVLDLTLWSRARFGVPPYPAERIHRRLAAWIAATCPDGMPMRAITLSKADWLTGKRRETVESGQGRERRWRGLQ